MNCKIQLLITFFFSELTSL